MTVVKFSPLLCFIGVYLLLMVRCDCLQIQLTSSRFDQGKGNKELQVSIVKLLPRKLQVLTGKVTVTVPENAAQNMPEKILPDKLNWKQASRATAKPRIGEGKTWKQWMDNNGDSSEYFTMDYSRVRRRRPIHNKSLPVGP